MKILFLGRDNRYKVVIETLKNRHDIYTIGYSDMCLNGISRGYFSKISEYDIIVLPMTGIKDGIAGNVVLQPNILDDYHGIIFTGNKKGISGNVISFLDDEEIKSKNTDITVDGIMDRIKNVEKTSICILGYGNIGKKLYDRLKDKYLVIVGVEDKDEGIIKNSFLTSNKYNLKKTLINSRLVINTVPKNIIDEDILNAMTGTFLDIASYPYAIKQNKAYDYPFDYQLYSSIPSKYDPVRAGKILLKKFEEVEK